MKSPRPKANMVAAFLRLNNWTETDRGEKYITFSPPKEMKFEGPFSFKIPVSETAVDYKEYIQQVVFSITEMYDLNKWELVEELSKTSFDIQKEIENKQREIAFKKRLLAIAS
jgi:hypothetical protein